MKWLCVGGYTINLDRVLYVREEGKLFIFMLTGGITLSIESNPDVEDEMASFFLWLLDNDNEPA